MRHRGCVREVLSFDRYRQCHILQRDIAVIVETVWRKMRHSLPFESPIKGKDNTRIIYIYFYT